MYIMEGSVPNRIQINAGSISHTATLRANETAAAIYNALPIEGLANRWGEEIYFSIPVQLSESEDARQVMEVGELGYWPTGSAFCIFFGPTPVSQENEPRAYSNVNPFGQIDGDASNLVDVQEGDRVRIEKASQDER
jgi:hypothetical protein